MACIIKDIATDINVSKETFLGAVVSSTLVGGALAVLRWFKMNLLPPAVITLLLYVSHAKKIIVLVLDIILQVEIFLKNYVE